MNISFGPAFTIFGGVQRDLRPVQLLHLLETCGNLVFNRGSLDALADSLALLRANLKPLLICGWLLQHPCICPISPAKPGSIGLCTKYNSWPCGAAIVRKFTDMNLTQVDLSLHALLHQT